MVTFKQQENPPGYVPPPLFLIHGDSEFCEEQNGAMRLRVHLCPLSGSIAGILAERETAEEPLPWIDKGRRNRGLALARAVPDLDAKTRTDLCSWVSNAAYGEPGRWPLPLVQLVKTDTEAAAEYVRTLTARLDSGVPFESLDDVNDARRKIGWALGHGKRDSLPDDEAAEALAAMLARLDRAAYLEPIPAGERDA